MYDKTNGQRLFQPNSHRQASAGKIRSSARSKKTQGKNISHRLYENAQFQREKRARLQQRAVEIQNMQYARPTQRSNQLVANL